MIKLLIGGSPCTYWSIAQNNGRETEPQGMGWELFKNYLIAKEKFKPDFFLYENNKSASEAIKSQIRTELGVWDGTFFTEDTGARYIEINSALVSAQNRQRFYVHNCGEVIQPEDRGMLLRDIIEGDGADGKTGLYAIPINETEDGKSQTIKAQYHFTSVQNICCYSSTYGASGVAIPTEEKPQAFEGKGKDPDAMKRIYEVKDGLIIIKGKQYPIKLADGYYNIRKLTVTECCRLQTMPEIIQNLYIDFNEMEVVSEKWFDHQKTDAQYAEEKCRRLQKLAESALNIDFQAFALCVENNLNIRLQQTEKPALLNVHINYEEKSNRKNCLKELKRNVSIAEQNLNCHHQEVTEDFAQAVVGINLLLQKMQQIGEVELRLKDRLFAVVKNGKMRLTLCGQEIIQLAKGVEINTKEVEKIFTSITSEVTQNTKNCEQMLTTLFCYVLNAIGGYILNKTNGKILLSIKMPYTFAVSATQAYKGLGNGWTAEVIIHILSKALENVPRDEEIVVLSMYDGIGTGRYCLDKMGFTNVKYYAYEIDEYAKKIALSNYPDIIQMGDAFQVREEDWSL